MRAPRHVGTIHGYAISKRTPALLTSQPGSARDRQHRHHSPVAAAHSACVQPTARPDKRKAIQLTATQPPLFRASNSTASQPASQLQHNRPFSGPASLQPASQLTATQPPLFRASKSTASQPADQRELRLASRSPVTLIVNICYSGCLQITTNIKNFWFFGLCPLSGILETRKHNH
jgi:hypothetical protein